MYKKSAIAIMLVGSGNQLLAGTGSGNDAHVFVIGIIVLLLLMAGLLQGIDYLRRNGPMIIDSAKASLKRILRVLRRLSHKDSSRHHDVSPL